MNVRRLDALVAAVLIASCANPLPTEGPPIRIMVDPELAPDGPFFGVFEVREGDCTTGDAAPIYRRNAFPQMSSEAPEGEPFMLTRAQSYCFRVFAISSDPYSATQECTILSLGEVPVEAGSVDQVTVVVPAVAAGELVELNARYGPVHCPPSPIAPFDGEHLGSPTDEACAGGDPCAQAPRFHFRENNEAAVYCLEVSPEGDPGAAEQIEIAAGPDPTVAPVWSGAPLGESHASYAWRVRSCAAVTCPGCAPTACPSDAAARYNNGAERCTEWSRPRRFVARPWGNLNDDAQSDFVIGGSLETQVYVFRSGAAPGGPDTYDICGSRYSLERIVLPAGVCEDHPTFMTTKLFGIGTAVADVGGDHRSEIIATEVNCNQVMGTDSAGTGGVFFFDGESSERLATHHFTTSDGGIGVRTGYGLSVRVTRRSNPDRATVTTLGIDVSAMEFNIGIAPLRTGLIDLGGTTSAVEVVRDQIEPFTGIVVGRGDLSGDAREDLLFREQVLLAAPRPAALPAAQLGFEHVPIALGSYLLLIAGDADDDGRAEILEFGAVDPFSCEQEIVGWELNPDTGMLDSTGFRYVRRLPNFSSFDCVSTSINPRCESVGGACRINTTCPACDPTSLSEQVFGIHLPHGTVYTSNRPGTALMRNTGMVVVDANGNQIASFVRPGYTGCAGVVMRAYDFDADGNDDVLLLDPGGDFLQVVCGDAPSPSPVVVASDDGVPFAPDVASTTPLTCSSVTGIWSVSP